LEFLPFYFYFSSFEEIKYISGANKVRTFFFGLPCGKRFEAGL